MKKIMTNISMRYKIIHSQRNVGETWWRHKMEIFSTLLALCEGNSPVAGEFPSQRPVTRSFDVFFDLRLNKRLTNNQNSGELRRHRAYYHVTVMKLIQPQLRHGIDMNETIDKNTCNESVLYILFCMLVEEVADKYPTTFMN